jgi:23S rRNA (pseudouridine1915-N3)-methyltransferase
VVDYFIILYFRFMISVKIIAVGKLKEQYWNNSVNEYLKRLSPYAKIDIVELKEEAFKSENEREEIQKKEAEKILKNIQPDDVIITLHERGKKMTSVDLAKMLEQKSQQGNRLTFIIGGPLGLHDSVLKKSDLQLSLSTLTFPHQMVRTILLEQLYRSVMIGKGKYHY